MSDEKSRLLASAASSTNGEALRFPRPASGAQLDALETRQTSSPRKIEGNNGGSARRLTLQNSSPFDEDDVPSAHVASLTTTTTTSTTSTGTPSAHLIDSVSPGVVSPVTPRKVAVAITSSKTPKSGGKRRIAARVAPALPTDAVVGSVEGGDSFQSPSLLASTWAMGLSIHAAVDDDLRRGTSTNNASSSSTSTSNAGKC